MKIKAIDVTTLPPEAGPPGERLVILTEDGRYQTILIEQPITTYMLAERLEELARTLKAI